MHRTSALGLVVLASLVGIGCSTESSDDGGPETPAPASGPTYYKDVYPLIQTRCVSCHVEGGIAPFALTDASAAVSVAAATASAVQARTMPPWSPTELSVPLRDARTLSDQEIATFVAWEKAGAPLGDPADQPDVEPPGFPIESPPDISVDTGAEYAPNPTNPKHPVDDFRCFAVELGNAEARDVIGTRVVPGNPAVVHHVVMQLVDAADLAALQAYDARSPEPGWECSGDVIPEETGVRAKGGLGAWTPGDLGRFTYPGTGIALPAHAVTAMQIHYNVANGKGADRTRLELYFAPDGKAVQSVRRIGLGTRQIAIPANASGVTVTKTLEIGAPIPNGTGVALSDGFLLGALGHGHYLMTNHRMTLNPGTPSQRVVLDLDWNFHWQGSYLFQEPLAVHKGDVLQLDCTYDNTTEHRLAVGVDPMSTNVTFGETSEDEMCIGTFDMVTELP